MDRGESGAVGRDYGKVDRLEWVGTMKCEQVCAKKGEWGVRRDENGVV